MKADAKLVLQVALVVIERERNNYQRPVQSELFYDWAYYLKSNGYVHK